jgi:ABC-type nitrate/sulfonate/bicarbonate transport system substrate-binding protein
VIQAWEELMKLPHRRQFLHLAAGVAALPPASLVARAQQPAATRYKFKAAVENPAFEWFFLLVDAGKDQGIWARYGLDPEFVSAAGSAAQLKERVDAGIKIGFVNTAEVPLARSTGTPTKVVAGYFGETTARIFASANGSIKTAKDLNGKKIGIVATTHTSYRTALFMNEKLAIKAEPIPLGALQNNLAALKSGQIDAFYSAEGAALTLVDTGDVQLLLPLADIYPKPYTAVVVWVTDDLIKDNPDLVSKFVKATLDIVSYLKANPDHAISLYIKRTSAAQNVAEKAVASLNQILSPSGRGSGQDLIAAVAGNWQFIIESGAVPANINVKIQEAVDTTFLPPLARIP